MICVTKKKKSYKCENIVHASFIREYCSIKNPPVWISGRGMVFRAVSIRGGNQIFVCMEENICIL